MDETFDVDAFITRIGTRLVEQFDDARRATSPSTVGAAMEQPVRQQLEQILPRGIGVGSGFVIDSSQGTSRQMDVVLYEKDICPVFSINGTPETTYYPCEGVIAAGEIKSSIGTKELKDCFRKIASVKRLRRHFVRFPIPNPDTGEPLRARSQLWYASRRLASGYCQGPRSHRVDRDIRLCCRWRHQYGVGDAVQIVPCTESRGR